MNPTATHPFRQRLMEHRLSRGLSLYRLAQLSGISAPHLGKLEAGEAHPYLWTAQVLAAALGVPLDYLAGPLPTLPEAGPPKGRGGPRKANGERPAEELIPHPALIGVERAPAKRVSAPHKKRRPATVAGDGGSSPATRRESRWAGEPIEPLGLTAEELDASAMQGAWVGVNDKCKWARIHSVTLGKDQFAVEDLGDRDGDRAWWLHPLWTEGEWMALQEPKRRPSRFPERREEEGKVNTYYAGVAVLVGKRKWVIGPMSKGRVVVCLAQRGKDNGT